MFYDNFMRLCEKKGITPSRAAIAAGLSKSTVTRWKQNPDIMPSGAVLDSLANYFGVQVSELLGEEKEKLPVSEDQELDELLERLKNRKECRMLFQLADNATAEDVRQAVRIIEAIRKE